LEIFQFGFQRQKSKFVWKSGQKIQKMRVNVLTFRGLPQRSTWETRFRWPFAKRQVFITKSEGFKWINLSDSIPDSCSNPTFEKFKMVTVFWLPGTPANIFKKFFSVSQKVQRLSLIEIRAFLTASMNSIHLGLDSKKG